MYHSGRIARVEEPNLATILGGSGRGACEFAHQAQCPGLSRHEHKGLEVEDPKLLGAGCGFAPLSRSALEFWGHERPRSFSVITAAVLVGRAVAAGCRRKKALGGAEKGLVQSDRQCSRWRWHFLEELSLHVKNARRRRFHQSLTRSRRRFARNPICTMVPFSGYAQALVSFDIRQYESTTKENSKPVYNLVLQSEAE